MGCFVGGDRKKKAKLSRASTSKLRSPMNITTTDAVGLLQEDGVDKEYMREYDGLMVLCLLSWDHRYLIDMNGDDSQFKDIHPNVLPSGRPDSPQGVDPEEVNRSKEEHAYNVLLAGPTSRDRRPFDRPGRES